jgi:hypothetical protein
MSFFVVYDDESHTVYDFKENTFIDEKLVNQNCIMPSLTFALKVINFPYLFLRTNHTGKLIARKVKISNHITDNASDQEENKIEVSW